MSKDLNKNILLSVETVENWHKTLDWIYSTIIFWKLDNIWPTNLIKNVLNELCKEIITSTGKNNE